MRQLNLTIALALVLAVPAVAQTPPVPEGEKIDPRAPEAMRCRQIPITGSLVKKERVCKTNAEWARINDNGNRNARDIVGSGAICAGGSCGNGN